MAKKTKKMINQYLPIVVILGLIIPVGILIYYTQFKSHGVKDDILPTPDPDWYLRFSVNINITGKAEPRIPVFSPDQVGLTVIDPITGDSFQDLLISDDEIKLAFGINQNLYYKNGSAKIFFLFILDDPYFEAVSLNKAGGEVWRYRTFLGGSVINLQTQCEVEIFQLYEAGVYPL